MCMFLTNIRLALKAEITLPIMLFSMLFVLKLLHYTNVSRYSFFDNYLPWYIQRYELVMDNAGNFYRSTDYVKITFCSGTNKSQYVVNGVLVEPVRLMRFLEALITFLTVGHTKTLADKMFADITHVCTKQDIFNHLYVLLNDDLLLTIY